MRRLQQENPREFRDGVAVTRVATHHFFVIKLDPANPSIDYGEPMCDDLGRTLVYTDRLPAEKEACRRWDKPLIAIVGMGDKNWKLFQQHESWILAEERCEPRD